MKKYTELNKNYKKLKEEYDELQTKCKQLQTERRKQKHKIKQLVAIREEHRYLFPVKQPTPNQNRGSPGDKRQEKTTKYLKQILFGHHGFKYGYNELCSLFDKLLKEAGTHTFNVSDCLYAVQAVLEYFEKTGTGSGANRIKLRCMQTVAASIMHFDNELELLNKNLFRDCSFELNVLPQRCNKHRKKFFMGCKSRRRAFDQGNSLVLCKLYKNEKRISSFIYI